MFIKRAAILYQHGGIVEGKSYSKLMQLGHKLGFTSGYVFGFVDSSDNFIDRNKALEIAISAGQLPEDFKGPLTPQDLWDENEDDNAVD